MSAAATESSSNVLQRKFAVLLLAHGTPESVEEIPEYLRNVVSGRPIPQQVVEEIQHRYSRIGKSPLTRWTVRQATLLQEALDLPVYVGMRNWKPYIADTVRKMRSDGITDAIAICLAPQNSRTSVGLYRRAAYAEAGGEIRFFFVDSWAAHPLLADAFAERLRLAWRLACNVVDANVPVVFTAHSVPCQTVLTRQPSENSIQETGLDDSTSQPAASSASAASETVRPTVPERSYATPAGTPPDPDLYAIEAKQTASLVAERLAADGLTEQDWYFAFQSQGMSGGPWIGPTVEDTLQAIQQEGHRGVVLQPVGFLCDHVEILYDIDIGFQDLTRKLNLQLFRPESLNDSPLLIEALADLASRGLTELIQAADRPSSTQSASR
ncbi:MAG: ferrochelatase [Acidobacteriaceae bacterium]